MEENEESVFVKFSGSQKQLLIDTVVLALMGPFGILRLLKKNLIDWWQLIGLLFVWIAFFWSRWISEFGVLSVVYEIFIIGLFIYGVIIIYPTKSEVDKKTIVLVTLIFLMIAITGYSEICVARNVKNFNSPIDFFVIGNGLVWYGIISYRALSKRSNCVENGYTNVNK